MDPLVLPPALLKISSEQGGVFTRAQAARTGLDGKEVERRRRAGQLIAVRRGVYAEGQLSVDARAVHRRAASARRLVMAGDVVVSHDSAAYLLGYRLLGSPPSPPALTVVRPAGQAPLRVHDLFSAALPAGDRHALLPRLPVTSPARTIADCCRSMPRDAALVVADSALGRGVPREAVLAVLARCARWPGAVAAADVVRFADGRAESVLESLARQWFLEQALPAPELQLEICRGDDGTYVGRVDFIWREQRTVCEVDGRLKYRVDDQLRPGDPLRDPLFLEKQREDLMRDLGLEVVRGYWSDGDDRGRRLAGRLRQAFARGAARADRPRYGVRTPLLGRPA